MKHIICCISTFTFLAAGTSFAAHPLVSDDAGTLGQGTIQVELNGDIGTDKESHIGETTKTKSSQMASTIGFGLSDKIDVVFGYTHPWGEVDVDDVTFKDHGSSDFSLNMKWQVYEQDGFSAALKPQIGYSYALEVPDNDYTVSYGATMILSKEVEPFAFYFNIGYTYNDYNLEAVRKTDRSGLWNVSLATTYEVIKDLKIVADFGARTNEDKDVDEMPVFGLAGIIYSINKNCDLSAGLKLGLTTPETDITGTTGLTLKF